MRWHRQWKVFSLAAALLMAAFAADAQAQQIAGVQIDASGVLALKVYDGRLNQAHIQAARRNLDPELARVSKMRYVSLNRLEAALAENIASGKGPTDEMRYLAGMTQLTHVFFLPETNDIVIAGPAEGFVQDISGRVVGAASGQSVLELQDLVVALRAFAPRGNQTALISVSIDPTPEGLQQMQQFLSSIAGRVTPNDAGRIADGLRQSLGMQTVTFHGVSPKTHFAQVLVEADYRMKLIGIGLEQPPVNIPSYVSKASPSSVARNAMQRWYFTPNYECVRVSDDEHAMEMVGEGVKLIGEDELVTAAGGRVAADTSNRASQIFVKAFTDKYAALAEKAPVYGQLRNLIDMSIAAAFIQQQDYYGQAGWELGVLGDESKLPVELYTAPTQVETAVNVVWKGRTLMTPVGGGVNIQATRALDSQNLLSDEEGQLRAAQQQVSVDTLAKDQWWWD